MLDTYKKTVTYCGDQREIETAYERLALWLLEFGKQEGIINGLAGQNVEVVKNGKSA